MPKVPRSSSGNDGDDRNGQIFFCRGRRRRCSNRTKPHRRWGHLLPFAAPRGREKKTPLYASKPRHWCGDGYFGRVGTGRPRAARRSEGVPFIFRAISRAEKHRRGAFCNLRSSGTSGMPKASPGNSNQLMLGELLVGCGRRFFHLLLPRSPYPLMSLGQNQPVVCLCVRQPLWEAGIGTLIGSWPPRGADWTSFFRPSSFFSNGGLSSFRIFAGKKVFRGVRSRA